MPNDIFNHLSSSPLSFSGRRAATLLAFVLSLLLLNRTATAQIPGLQVPSTSEASDQKRGSILFFNYFTSSSTTPNTTNTEISITNTSSTTPVTVRLFFVDGTTGASVSTFLFLTQIQTATFLASNVLPGVSGYLVAVAVDSVTQCPINFNTLIGEAVFKQATGHSASLDAVAVAAVATSPASCVGTTTTLNFDGVNYNRVPRVVTLDNIVSRTDGNDTLFIINRVGGNLTVGSSAATLAVLFGLLYDDADTVTSFTRTQATPQFVTSLTNSFPMTSPLFQNFIPAGRTGSMKIYNNANDFGYLGASVNFNPNAGASLSAFNSGHNFTHRTLATAPNFTVPLTAPDLVVTKTHSGNFTLGGTGSYTITVTNNGSAMSSMLNQITLSDQLPTNLTLAGFSGTGWNCGGGGANGAPIICVTNQTLGAGASAPVLTLTVNINAGTPTGANSITNTVTVSNPQEFNTSNNSSSNPTTVCGFVINPAAASFTVAGGSSTVGVTATAGCGWTAVSNAPWITVTGGSSGTGNGTVSYTVAANAGAAPRTGTITIAGINFVVSQAATGVLVYTDFTGGIPVDWTVEHFGVGTYPGGAPATWTTSNPCMRDLMAPFSGMVAIVDATCAGPGATFDERLIPPSFNASGLGTIFVEFFNRYLGLVAPNNIGDLDASINGGTTWPGNVHRFQNVDEGPTPTTRSFNLTPFIAANPANARIRLRYTSPIGGPSLKSLRPEIQEASWALDFAIYYFTLSPTSQNFSANGGSGNVSVSTAAIVPSPQGAWTATSNVTWITPGAAGGTGNGSIGYTVAANSTTSPRTGTVTIAGNTFTVMQNGCTTPTINPALPNGFVSVAYNQTLTASGGVAPYTFSVSAGTLPNGLSLTAAGVLSGMPTTNGTFSFTVKATDNIGCMGTRTYTVIISGSGPNSLMFYPLPSPVRLLDTRPGASPTACTQPNTPIASGTSLTQAARGICTIPANAQAITGNVTTVASGGGYLTLYPSGATQPTVASTNYSPNEIVNNVFTVGLGAADGAFKIFALNTTDVVVDVTGYYAPPSASGLYFHTLPAPVRLLETRAGQSVGCVKPGAPLTGGQDSLQTATTACTGIPAAARAIVGNATTIGPQTDGYLTLFPADATRPTVASSNYNSSQVVNGPFTVGLSSAGQFKIFTLATTDLVVDLLGYYSTEAADANGAGLLFTPLAHPIRLLETRSNPPNLPGCFKPNAPLNGTQVYTQSARGLCDGVTIPASALGVVGNATVILPQAGGFLTLWPSSAATQPTAATANFGAGQVVNRHFIVGLGNADGSFKMFSSATTDLVIDLSGYFAP